LADNRPAEGRALAQVAAGQVGVGIGHHAHSRFARRFAIVPIAANQGQEET
jgi:hypothetical protein